VATADYVSPTSLALGVPAILVNAAPSGARLSRPRRSVVAQRFITPLRSAWSPGRQTKARVPAAVSLGPSLKAKDLLAVERAGSRLERFGQSMVRMSIPGPDRPGGPAPY
jgi:hypothetical protein